MSIFIFATISVILTSVYIYVSARSETQRQKSRQTIRLHNFDDRR